MNASTKKQAEKLKLPVRAKGQRPFRLAPAERLPEGQWLGLNFSHRIERAEKDAWLRGDPVISTVCGEKIEYGCLFAYRFRRFGYPNLGWDDYKQLAAYLLKTPSPDLFLSVVPYVGDTACITLSFLVPSRVFDAVEAYERRPLDAWRLRSYDWAEQQGLPDWMDDWVKTFNTDYRAAYPTVPEALNWRDAVQGFWFPLGEPSSAVHRVTKRVSDFVQKIDREYRKVEKHPKTYRRPFDWTTWNADDPLRPLIEAALVALQDLYTPVGVRESSINAFGRTRDSARPVQPAKSTGFPCGALGNQAPEEFSKLHGAVLQLGNGDVKKGIRKLLASTPHASATA